MRPHSLTLALLTAFAITATAAARPVWACGGCFIPVPTSSTATPVLQNAERILFAEDPLTKRSHVWVEIRYSGPPGDFSWVLPLPKVPTVTVGDSWLFDRLDAATGATFRVTGGGSENCNFSSSSSSVGCGSNALGGGASDSAPKATTGPNGEPLGGDGVVILKHAQVGPYDYTLVQATSKTEGAAKMVAWLQANKYAVPDASKPIMDDHVARGDVFIAVKLAAGASSKEVRPIVLEMEGAEACVPLRLTSIAAEDDMNVVVTVAGAARAIPKNHLHVAINPMRLDWFGGAANYPQVLAAAIDEAAGRAFATEYAGKLPSTIATTGPFGNEITTATFPLTSLQTNLIASTKRTTEAWAQIVAQQLPITESTAAILEAYLHVAADVDQDPVDVYRALLTSGGPIKDVPIDGKALAADLEETFCKPVREMAQRLGSVAKVTRMVLRISPSEMTKDPVFAYSPTLPDVSNVLTAKQNSVCRAGDFNPDAQRLTVENMGSWVFDLPTSGLAKDIKTAGDPRFAKSPAAFRVEVLDETGEPFAVRAEDVGKVDLAIANAHAGKPSLDLALTADAATRWTPPAPDALFGSSSSSRSSGCTQGRTPVVPAALLLVVAGMVLRVRRRSRLGQGGNS